jgi:hypothetical protein
MYGTLLFYSCTYFVNSRKSVPQLYDDDKKIYFIVEILISNYNLKIFVMEMFQEFIDNLMTSIHVTTQHPNFWVSSPWHN